MDHLTPKQRSAHMSKVRARGNKSTELALISIFRDAGIRGWRRGVRLPGRPDFVFRVRRVALFVDGCFWHGCRLHGRMPKSNVAFWAEKIRRNRLRDLVSARELRKSSWTVLRVWEHELKPNYRRRLVGRLRRAGLIA